MEAFLGKITAHAMNYAIRSGIGITASFAISQTSRLLKTVDNNADSQELHALQERLDSKIRIISPAIDMIELISARGNTTLSSAVTLTKGLRWDIQALGVRLQKAAAAEELSRKNKTRATSRAAHEMEIRQIVQDIKKLLVRIEDAVPLINLAITTSGASLSTTLPASVSPSRLLQASTFLTAGDTQYSMNLSGSVQVGPSFTLSLYMLFASHTLRANADTESIRTTTWKEVIHKARVKLVRIPLNWNSGSWVNGARSATEQDRNNDSVPPSFADAPKEPLSSGSGSTSEFAYRLQIIEDLDDDRLHSVEEGGPQPGPYDDVQLAGIRELLPIHQISKIFYADTGKILNIGNQGETNNPVLLLKRDINALPPRDMMQEREKNDEWQAQYEDFDDSELDDESQDDIDRQIRRESSVHLTEKVPEETFVPEPSSGWEIPPDLDPQWLAFEVYTEAEEDSSSEDGQDANGDSAYRSPSSRELHPEAAMTANLAELHLEPSSSPTSSISHQQVASSAPSPTPTWSPAPRASPFGPILSSLSLLEMLIRLTALQQFQQASHLSIPDEFLTFFLEESSTTGAGGDGDERRRTRRDARRTVGFDPYNESPVKHHGEEYQYQNQRQSQEYEREVATPHPYEYDQEYTNGFERPASPRWMRERGMMFDGSSPSPEPRLLSSREGLSSRPRSPASSSSQPYRPPARRPARPLDRVMQERGAMKTGSPLGRGVSVETDSTLGTSPGSPTLVNRREKADADGRA